MRVVTIAGVACVLLAFAPATALGAGIGGTATFANGSPAAGIDVALIPEPPPAGDFPSLDAMTDEQGRWRIDAPAGGYDALFIVIEDGGSRSTRTSEPVTAVDGTEQTLDVSVPGDPGVPQARLTGTASGPGLLAGMQVFARFSPEPPYPTPIADGYGSEVAAGAYHVTVQPPEDADAEEVGFDVALAPGQTLRRDVTLPPLAITGGTSAKGAASALAAFNAERARWGPAGLVLNDAFSDACASHDAYLRRNDVLEHEESPGKPGYSPGGNWAGTHAVLSSDADWTAAANPWEDAPIHLIQMMTPNLRVIGIDASGPACATTWPGMLGDAAPPGTVITYPGNGTTGLPPAENAREQPMVPGDRVGIPEGTVAGRELFVYQEGVADRRVDITAATLTGPSGKAQVRWVDTTDPKIGAFLTGAILIPVQPLEPKSRYTATVQLAPSEDGTIPAVSHIWSFTTGRANPTGEWAGTTRGTGGATPRISRARVKRRRVVFRLSTPATVRLTVRRGGRKVRTIKRRCRAGRNRVALRRLKPGRYRVTLRASSGYGRSRPVNVRFRVR